MTKVDAARKKRKKGAQPTLEVMRPMVAGIDIGSEEHFVCGPARDDGEREVRVFRATTAQLRDMAAWLLEQGVESVAMESTYLYWIPVYEVLEAAGLEVVLVNARMLHNVPGRKTDVRERQLNALTETAKNLGFALVATQSPPTDAPANLVAA